MIKLRKDVIKLFGKKFGKWTVLNDVERRSSDLYWLCRCECGAQKFVSGNSLKQGKSTNCGCTPKKTRKKENLLGQKFNRLLVIKDAEKKGNRAAWLCKCDCGNEVIVRANDLKSGNTKSCGCYKKELSSERLTDDLIGKKFGKLVVIERRGSTKFYQPKWLCKCECGGQTITTSGHLKSGDTKSCGCIQSFGEEIVGKLLTENNITFEKEYTFDDLRSDKGNLLRFDFAIFKDGNLSHLIEYDGIQHYDKSYGFYKESVHIHDKMKNVYCEGNNIKLIRLRDYNVLTIEDLL